MKKRTTLEIVVTILEVIREPTIKSHIMYKANLNGIGLGKYLRALISSGLIHKGVGTKIYKKKPSYKRTEKGTQLLNELMKAHNLLTEFSTEYDLQ